MQDDEQTKNQVTRTYSKDDFSSVNRFESHGGGWGYSGHSIEAIRFMADTDILVGGFGLFGGRGEYIAKLRLYDIGPDGGEQEGDGDVLAETEETPYECGARQKYPVLFDEPVLCQANRWYVAWARVSGPSSDCGSSGQSVVNTDDQVVFYFKSSKKSNNGTDVNAGQIPLILYKLATVAGECATTTSNNAHGDDQDDNGVVILSREFSMAVSPECFSSLTKLLRWAWQSFKTNVQELSAASATALDALMTELRHLTYVCCASLHLLKTYVNEVFPNGRKRTFGLNCDILRLAECVADTRTLMKKILLDGDSIRPLVGTGTAGAASSHAVECDKIADLLFKQILNECHCSFVACYHAFYPSTTLRWRGLCDLLLQVGTVEYDGLKRTDHLVAAILASLCSPLIRLTVTFPLNQSLEVESVCSPSDLASPTGNGTTTVGDPALMQEPVLVEKMTDKCDRENCHTGLDCSFRDILIKLLTIIGQPIECTLYKHRRSFEILSDNSSLDSDDIMYRDLYDNPPSRKLVENTCVLLSAVISELVAQATGIGFDVQTPIGQTLYTTPTRFSRVSQNRTWNTGNGSPDAICFSVDRPGIMIAGATVYGGLGNEWHYELELLDYTGGSALDVPDRPPQPDGAQSHQWCAIDVARGTYTLDEKNPDTAEIRFERPIPIRDNVKYALRLRNHGARTNNGDGGLTHVRGPDGTTFTFTDCSLSFNGTNHTRGQIPQILYYSSPPATKTPSQPAPQANQADEATARRNVLAIADAVAALAEELFAQAQHLPIREAVVSISSSLLVTKLLPSVLSSLAPIATTDPKSATQILSLIKKLLPLVALLVKKLEHLDGAASSTASPPPSPSVRSIVTTSKQYVVVESDHPYKPASVSNYKVTFPASVKWLSIEFDPRCGTAQPEDGLQLLIPSTKRVQAQAANKGRRASIKDNVELCANEYWPVFRKFTGKPGSFPTACIVLPGNEVVFSLETASDYVKDDKACYYGFRAQVVGYESPTDSTEGLVILEQELAYLGATSVNALLSRDLNLPPLPDDIPVDDADVTKEFATHAQVLSKGLALAHMPAAQEALDGILALSHEKPFLKDFINCTPGTSGGRLARWLQPEPYADANQCEVNCTSSAGHAMQCGWPASITVTTRDQYGAVVHVPGLRVEVCAQPFHTAISGNNSTSDGSKSPKLSRLEEKKENMSFGGLPAPQVVPYTVTMKDKMMYHAITMMPQHENYSFEVIGA